MTGPQDTPGNAPPDPRSDPIDALLGGGAVDDPALRTLVHDLRRGFLPDEAPTRSTELVSFAGPGGGIRRPDASADTPRRPRRRVRIAAAAAALVATSVGKVLLGGAVAAAAVGGLHAAEVVSVPFLPEVGGHADEPRDGPHDPDAPGGVPLDVPPPTVPPTVVPSPARPGAPPGNTAEVVPTPGPDDPTGVPPGEPPSEPPDEPRREPPEPPGSYAPPDGSSRHRPAGAADGGVRPPRP